MNGAGLNMRVCFHVWLRQLWQFELAYFSRMPLSRMCVATRAFVTVLLALARRYEVVLLPVNRDSPADVLVKSYKKLLLKVHPDKGGRKQDVQKLQAARELCSVME